MLCQLITEPDVSGPESADRGLKRRSTVKKQQPSFDLPELIAEVSETDRLTLTYFNNLISIINFKENNKNTSISKIYIIHTGGHMQPAL